MQKKRECSQFNDFILLTFLRLKFVNEITSFAQNEQQHLDKAVKKSIIYQSVKDFNKIFDISTFITKKLTIYRSSFVTNVCEFFVEILNIKIAAARSHMAIKLMSFGLLVFCPFPRHVIIRLNISDA